MIFVDTSAFFALYFARDQHHAAAKPVWAQLRRPLYTSNHVLDELATLLGRRIGYSVAVDRVADIYASPTFEILRTSAEDETAALGLMKKFADHRIRFTDCLSFVLMRRERLRSVFTFDGDFRVAGFELIP